ncbi:PAS domain-containing sensor histidine kinase [Heyndrickxia ginsengihumi]|uniref:PAS domain-containing sensor histidine kinase n=1 Tax=Heyndrickxia ginsengihumi TaxID=363870 RepID=UPI00046F110E|nr:ATP-binding protein [Heyndrickxia ginsengihumi]MCM3024953.1 ATP-binding protein [Heyndrickxia ginsengihumi]
MKINSLGHKEPQKDFLLKNNEQLFKSLFEEAIDGIVFWKHDGSILMANRAALKIFECSLEEFKNKKLWDFVFQKNARFHQIIQEINRSNAVRSELLFLMPNGQRKHLEFTSKYICAEDHHMTIFRNVSDRYQMEQTLRDSEERFRKIFEGSFDGMILWDWDYKIIDINPVAACYFECEREEMLNKSLQELLHTNNKFHREFQDHITKLKKNGVADYLFPIKRQNFTKYFEITSKGNLTSNMNLTVVRDITEKRALQEKLRKSDTLNIVGELAAGIAHEIRNPMTALKGFIQLLQSSIEEDHTLYFNIITSELARIESIITEFLVLAKPQAIQFQHQDIRKIMSDTIDLLNAQALMHNIEIDCHYPYQLPNAFCEGNQMKQVFINMIKNAIEVMPNGGKIEITIRYDEREQMIHTMIRDEGDGIPPDKIAKLGEPFYTTKERGTGLGLMISYKIIKEHRGRINVESEVGVGTTFHIYLPIQNG